MKKLILPSIVFLAFAFSTQVVHADYPKPTGFVNDYAHVLPAAFVKKEEGKLRNYQKQTTNEIAIATIDTTGDQAIEEYSIGLASQWKIGVSGKDNGVLLLFAMKDHKMRVEVGCGLESSLSDIQAADIISTIKPYFKQQDYATGIDKGVDKTILDLNGATPQPCKVGSQQAINDARNATANGGTNSGGGIVLLLIFILIAALLIGLVWIFSTNDAGSDDTDDTGGGYKSGFSSGILLGGMGGYAAGSHTSSDSDDDAGSSSNDSSSGFGGFSGGSFSGGGASGSW